MTSLGEILHCLAKNFVRIRPMLGVWNPGQSQFGLLERKFFRPVVSGKGAALACATRLAWKLAGGLSAPRLVELRLLCAELFLRGRVST